MTEDCWNTFIEGKFFKSDYGFRLSSRTVGRWEVAKEQNYENYNNLLRCHLAVKHVSSRRKQEGLFHEAVDSIIT
jgi:hypothetical protein